MAPPRSARPKPVVAAGRARSARPARREGTERRIALSPLERELLVRACERYRSALPSYLASARDEFRLLAAVLRKLT